MDSGKKCTEGITLEQCCYKRMSKISCKVKNSCSGAYQCSRKRATVLQKYCTTETGTCPAYVLRESSGTNVSLILKGTRSEVRAQDNKKKLDS